MSEPIPYPYLSSSILKNALSRQPKNENPLQVNEFKFILHRTPHIVYFCQSVNVPGITVGEVQFPTPFATKARRIGTSLDFENLTLDFLVNENMSNWSEIREWMRTLVNERDFKQQSENEFYKFSDATLILMNSKSLPFVEFTFRDVYPIGLGSINFDSKVTDINAVTCEVVFAYSGYEQKFYENP